MHIYIATDIYGATTGEGGGIIYTGKNSNGNDYYTSTDDLDVAGVIPDGYELTGINWSLDVSTGTYAGNCTTANNLTCIGGGNFNDTIIIDIDFKDADGDVLTDTGPGTFTATWGDGAFHEMNGTFTDADYLSDLSLIHI